MLGGMNEEPPSRNQARRGRAEIETILSDYRQSGLTQVRFARGRGLNLGTFRGWLARYRTPRAEGFCQVRVRGGQDEGLTIRLPDGTEISVRGGTDPRWVAAVARGLTS